MNPEEIRPVTARNEKWVPTKERVKIGTTNFWHTIKKVKGTNSYEFNLANKKCVVNVEVFRKILNICLRVQGEDFTEVLNDKTTLTFLVNLGYKGPVYKHPSIKASPCYHERIVTESNPEPTRRRPSSIAFKDTSSVSKKMSLDPSQKLKGIQILTSKEKLADDTMQALKANKKSIRSQPHAEGSKKLADDTMQALKANKKSIRSQPHAEGSRTGTKLRVPDEKKVSFEAKADVTLDWGSKQESGYFEEDQDDDDANDDKSIDLEKIDYKETDDEFVHSEENVQDDDEETDDKLVHGDEQVNDDEDGEMTNAEEADTDNGDEEITNAAKADVEKVEEVKDDIKEAELPLSGSSLFVFRVCSVKKALEKTLLLLDQSSSQAQSFLKAADSLSGYELTTILFDKINKSRSYITHDKHQALFDAFIISMSLVDAIASGQADLEKILRKRYRDGENPSAGPNYGKKTKRSRTKESEPSNKSSTSKESSKGKPPAKTSKSDDQPEQPWFNNMVSAVKDLLTFDELMAALIDFSKYAMNRLKIDNLTQAHLVGPVYEMLKGTCTSSIKLKYNMEECFKALIEKLD
nr:hypothetical protein [Tanacetum cinerariifolium]